MRNYTIRLLVIILFGCTDNLSAQYKEVEEMWQHQLDTVKVGFTKPMYLQISEEEILKLFDRQPSFGMYKDNYIVTGIPANERTNKNTADVKFQISVCQRLTKTILPFNTFLLLTYTQKSFWDVYKKSSPFGDSNYNPGLGLIKPVILNNQLRGMASIAFEHESNGKDSLESRSWNYFVLSGVYFFNAVFSAHAKIWAGFLSKGKPELGEGGNPDLYKYRGYGLVTFNYRSLNDKFWVSAVLNPRNNFRGLNTQLELNFKLGAKSNQYLFVQWYDGYCESLLEYKRYKSMLRVGFCIKSPIRNFY
jgi:phospholipase A1